MAINLVVRARKLEAHQQHSLAPLLPSNCFLIDNLLAGSDQSNLKSSRENHDCQVVVVDLSLAKQNGQVAGSEEFHRRRQQHQESKCNIVKSKFDELMLSDKLGEETNDGKRRSRTMFSDWQLASLEWRFTRNKYLNTSDRVKIAKMLHLNQLQVKTWFQVSRLVSG